MSSWVTAAFLSVAVLAPPQGEGQSPSPRGHENPSISVIALRGGKGDWTFAIDGGRIVRGVVNEAKGLRRFSRLLRESEREQLARLVAKLPRTQQSYSFGKSAPDITTDFGLSVGRGADLRKYGVSEYLEEADYGLDLRSVLATLSFLHTLVESSEASAPPPLEWRARKQ